MEITLTADQKQVLDDIFDFIENPDSHVFILKGYAGTGKTTLMQYLANQLKQKNKVFALLAPTGRAASILRNRAGLTASTIHGELYKMSHVDGEADDDLEEPTYNQFGQLRLIFAMRPPSSSSDFVYIVDEASMISDSVGDPTSYAHFGSGHLLSDLLHAVGKNKIIFVGDPCQLPPVGSLASPALDPEYILKKSKAVKLASLNEILRQNENSGILQLATKVRQLAEQETYEKWVKLPALNTPQVKLAPEYELTNLYLEAIEKHGTNHSMAICNSNIACLNVNKAVRKKIFGDPFAPLQIGDVLIVNQNNHLVPLFNGDFVRIEKIGEKRTSKTGLVFISVVVYDFNTKNEYQVPLSQETLFNGQPNLTPEQQRLLMADFSIRMRKEGIKPNTDPYFEALRFDPFLNSLRVNFGYAITCHKSQGGEWPEVYLMLNSKMYAMGPKALTRWWYTGITRAKQQLYIVNDWWIA